MKNKNDGFTLVELIVTIVIIAVVTLIATNAVLRQVNRARTEAFIDQVKQYVKAIDADVTENKEYDEYKIYDFNEYKIKSVDKQPDGGFAIKTEDNKYRIQVWSDKLEKCAIKEFDDGEITISKNLKTKSDCLSIASGKDIYGK
jgi:prepilin-type N-terminal cleavage/methylation domain-containing protein